MTKKLNARGMRLREWLADRETSYEIPVFQRPYRWGPEQIETLLSDLFERFEASERSEASGEPARHSLGTIVCSTTQTPGRLAVLDGEQRLTTLDLLLDEIERRINKARGEEGAPLTHPPLIRAYRWLRGGLAATETPRPASREQRQVIEARLDAEERLLPRGDAAALVCFRNFILDAVSVLRVVLPRIDEGGEDDKCGAVRHEAAAVFEIVNMRGIRLSPLDILKSRLLRLLGDDPEARRRFTHYWNHAEETLLTRGARPIGRTLPQLPEAPAAMPKPTALLTIAEILRQSGEEEPAAPQASLQPETKAIPPSPGKPPVDLPNALALAGELLKALLRDEACDNEEAAPAALQSTALTQKNFFEHFTALRDAADVWRLLAVLDVVLQTAANLAPYRMEKEKEAAQPANGPLPARALRQLAFSFMAANGWRPCGQYWLLALCHAALRETVPDLTALPDSADAFARAVSGPAPLLDVPLTDAFQEKGLTVLAAWGFAAARTDVGADGRLHTEKALEVVEAVLQDPKRVRALRLALAQNVPAWTCAHVSHWAFHLLDWLIWLDDESKAGEGPFPVLFQTMKAEAARMLAGESADEHEAARAFLEFLKAENRRRFIKGAARFHVVSRSSVEHWLAQEPVRKDAGELALRQGFGNLGLIDLGDNASLRDAGPADKTKRLLDSKRISNPPLKLVWLAVLSECFCSTGASFSGRHVRALTDFWARFIEAMEFPQG